MIFLITRHFCSIWLILLAATKQLYKWFSPSVCPFVRYTISLCSHHRIIMKFSGVITNDRRYVHAKGQGQKSKVKVTEVKTQLIRFRTVTPVWIHIWWWYDTQSLMMLRRGDKKIADFDPYWVFPDCNSSLNSPMDFKWCTKFDVV